MKFHKDHIEWQPYINKVTGQKEYASYFWFAPNWLPKELRYIGIERFEYDGVHVSFGFWFFNISWSTPYSKAPL
jgi:hypothetical protein